MLDVIIVKTEKERLDVLDDAINSPLRISKVYEEIMDAFIYNELLQKRVLGQGYMFKLHKVPFVVLNTNGDSSCEQRITRLSHQN